VSDFAIELARLVAATAEYRAAAIAVAAWLAANNRGPDAELDALATVETLATCMEMANGGASALGHFISVIFHNATNAHGRAGVNDAVAHGRLLARSDCPCVECTGKREGGVAAAQVICAAALTTGDPS
jgi:hypothetical protein